MDYSQFDLINNIIDSAVFTSEARLCFEKHRPNCPFTYDDYNQRPHLRDEIDKYYIDLPEDHDEYYDTIELEVERILLPDTISYDIISPMESKQVINIDLITSSFKARLITISKKISKSVELNNGNQQLVELINKVKSDKFPQPINEVSQLVEPINKVRSNKLSQSIRPISKLSQSIRPINKLSQSIRPISKLSQSIRPISKLSQSIRSINKLSQSIRSINKLSQSIRSINKLSQSINRIRSNKFSQPINKVRFNKLSQSIKPISRFKILYFNQINTYRPKIHTDFRLLLYANSRNTMPF
jgi:methyl-accepting chemotaxis protein